MFSKHKADLDKALRKRLSNDDASVFSILRYAMGWVDADGYTVSAPQGKAIRPMLCLFACEAVGGSINQALPAAVSLELIHNFSLIHDDVQDRDKTRHHRPTIWAVWGNAKAVASGNVMNAVADISLSSLLDEHVSLDDAVLVSRLLAEAYLEMIEGQYLDVSFEGKNDIELCQYIKMISKKTGALFQCALNIGSILGGGDVSTTKAFRKCGRHLGLAFQIRDDILGTWGDIEATGKPVGSDLRQKKNSLPFVYAMSKASGKDAVRLKDSYRNAQLEERDITLILEIMESLETLKYAENLARNHCDIALSLLESIQLCSKDQQTIEDLCDFLLIRKH